MRASQRYVFGGVTSSGSSILVTLLHKLGLNMVASAFVVQIVTDYADRLISIAIVVAVLAVLSNSMKQQIEREKRMDRYSKITNKNQREIVL